MIVWTQVDAEEMQAVRRVALSPEALCLSLGHFLELSFGAAHLRVHGRSLHSGFVRYFGTGALFLAAPSSQRGCAARRWLTCLLEHQGC